MGKSTLTQKLFRRQTSQEETARWSWTSTWRYPGINTQYCTQVSILHIVLKYPGINTIYYNTLYYLLWYYILFTIIHKHQIDTINIPLYPITQVSTLNIIQSIQVSILCIVAKLWNFILSKPKNSAMNISHCPKYSATDT